MDSQLMITALKKLMKSEEDFKKTLL